MIEENIKRIYEDLRKTSERVYGYPKDIVIVAVTKNVSVEEIKQSIRAGIRNIAENRIQEASQKFSFLTQDIKDIRKHFIGHLQKNKAKKAVEIFDVIQSIDTEELAVVVDRCSKNLGKIQECFVEVKISQEPTKYGVEPDILKDFLDRIINLSNIKVTGLMGIAPFFDDPEKTRPYFRKLREIFVDLKKENRFSVLQHLSMGMSNDFIIAVEEGATMVRIGTAIFGK